MFDYKKPAKTKCGYKADLVKESDGSHPLTYSITEHDGVKIERAYRRSGKWSFIIDQESDLDLINIEPTLDLTKPVIVLCKGDNEKYYARIICTNKKCDFNNVALVKGICEDRETLICFNNQGLSRSESWQLINTPAEPEKEKKPELLEDCDEFSNWKVEAFLKKNNLTINAVEHKYIISKLVRSFDELTLKLAELEATK